MYSKPEIIDHDLTEPRLRYLGRGGTYATIVDYEDEFRRLSANPVMANDLDLSTDEGKSRFNELVYSTYEGDVFSNVPRCACGYCKVGELEGEECPKCNSIVTFPTEQPIESMVWMRPPQETKAFMNIQVYTVLSKALTKDGFSVMDWLMDPKYRPPKLNAYQETMLKELKIRRGLRHLVENFWETMEGIFNASTVVYRNKDRKTLTEKEYKEAIGYQSRPAGLTRKTLRIIAPSRARELEAFLSKYRDRVFSTVLPFPSRIGFIQENVGDSKYVDPEMQPALNALLSIAKAENDGGRADDADSRVARAIKDLAIYYRTFEREKIYKKPGSARKHVFGQTPHFTFRTVITSEHLPHDHETIRIPWGAGIMAFKLHIANKVLKDGYTPNEVATLIYDNIHRHHPVIDKIFDELIEESPGGRGPASGYVRFPSLKHNSTTRYFINFKRDPANLSTSLPICSVVHHNSDFDGDYMSGQLALDKRMTKAWERHAAHLGLMSHEVPHRISNHPQLPAPCISTVQNYLEITDSKCKPYGG